MAFLFQFFGNTVKAFRDAACDAGQGITITAQGYRCTDHILKGFAFQKGRDGLRHCFLAGFHMAVTGPDLIAGAAEIISEVLLKIGPDLRLGASGAGQEDGRCRCLRMGRVPLSDSQSY